MKTVVVACKDIVLRNLIERDLKDTYQVVSFNSLPSALDYIYNSIPHLIVMSIDRDDPVGIPVLNDLKSDPMFHQLPVLAVVPDKFAIDDWKHLLVEDYVRRKNMEADFAARAQLTIVRSERIVEINPLTRLPGNISGSSD